MAGGPASLYLDGSALVKLVRSESESSALQAELVRWPGLLTSVMGELELLRVLKREGLDPTLAEPVLDLLGLVAFDEQVRREAGRVGSPLLRTLDAIHLATALSLGADQGGFACYDLRLAAEAEAAGLTLVAPG